MSAKPLQVFVGGVNVLVDKQLGFLDLRQGANTTFTVVENTATDKIDVTIASSAGGVTAHGSLTGLLNDDHTQYANLGQAETFTVGPQTIQTGSATNKGFRILTPAGASANPMEVFEGLNLIFDLNSSGDIRVGSLGGLTTRLDLKAGGANLAAFFSAGYMLLTDALDQGIRFGSLGDTNLYRLAANTLKTDDKFVVALEFNPLGDINHDGLNVGFFSAAPVAKPSAYTQTFATADKTHAARTSVAVATTAATQTTPWGYSTAAQADAIPVAINAVRADLDDTAQALNAVIDDLQALGLVG